MMVDSIITAANAAVFRTAAGGARPPTAEEQRRITAPPFRASMLASTQSRLALADAVVVPDWLAAYNAVYLDESQYMTGCCTACAANVATMACALNVQGVRIPQLSWGFGYYADTGDATFSLGSFGSVAVWHRTTTGCCTDALYSAAFVATHWQGRGPYPGEYLPPPAAYTDARTRRVLQWAPISEMMGNMVDQVDVLLAAGHPVVFSMGNHCMCLLSRSADGWVYYAKDSERGNMDLGYGRGVRGFTRDALAYAYDLATVLLVDVSAGTVIVPPLTTGNTQMLIDTIRADANALLLGSITQSQIDKLKADVNQLVADAGSTVPPAGVAYLAPGAVSVDAFGLHWTLGADDDPRYGRPLLCEGRALRRTTSAALVNGKVRCLDLGLWYEFSGGTQWSPQWTPTSAP